MERASLPACAVFTHACFIYFFQFLQGSLQILTGVYLRVGVGRSIIITSVHGTGLPERGNPLHWHICGMADYILTV